MKILALADLHLDDIQDRDILRRLGEAIREVAQEADLMIVAGDLAEDAIQNWPSALRWLSTLYPAKQTIVMPGNHDYYGGNLSTLDEDLDRICRDAGCSFGQCRRLVMGDVRILMATLWTDLKLFAPHGDQAVADTLWQAQMMPDYEEDVIMVDDPERQLRPEDTADEHAKQRAWLTSELAAPWDGRTVVVTHHAPSPAVVGALTPLSPCFASDLEVEIEMYRPDVWLFGHTHRSADILMPGGTLLRNVSIGYEEELGAVDMVEWVRRGLVDVTNLSVFSASSV